MIILKLTHAVSGYNYSTAIDSSLEEAEEFVENYMKEAEADNLNYVSLITDNGVVKLSGSLFKNCFVKLQETEVNLPHNDS